MSGYYMTPKLFFLYYPTSKPKTLHATVRSFYPGITVSAVQAFVLGLYEVQFVYNYYMKPKLVSYYYLKPKLLSRFYLRSSTSFAMI